MLTRCNAILFAAASIQLWGCTANPTTDNPTTVRKEPIERVARQAEVRRLTSALERTPNNVALLRELATEYWALGEIDSAQATFELALSKSPDLETRADLIGVLFDRGRYVDAAALAREIPTASAPEWLVEVRNRLNNLMKEELIAPVRVRQVGDELVNSIEMAFVKVPGGTFARGADDGDTDHRPVRQVTVGPYQISKYEVTEAQFKHFLDETGYHVELPGVRRFKQEFANDPVFGVSWNDAQAFTIWLSGREQTHYRLPTEAEWEFAARGTAGYREPWGNERGRPQREANWGRIALADLWAASPHVRRVGSFPRDRSTFGVFDMAGNVREWCLDEYDATYYSWSPVINPYGPVQSEGVKVLRGGSWKDPGPGDFAISRSKAGRNQAYTGYGFRVVREGEMPRTARGSTRAQPELLTVDAPRPLAEAIRQFENVFGWVVTYEDPRYQHESDLKDVTVSVRKPAAAASGRRAITPRGGPFVFQFEPPSANATRSQVAVILQSMVDDFNRLDYAGKFKVVTTASMIHVVPISVRSTSGAQVPHRSILDTRVSPVPPGRNAVEGLQALLAAAQQASGDRVVLGTIPTNLMVQSRMAENVQDDSVRDTLERTLHETGRRVSWKLLFSPPDQTYVLNLVW